jgi:hypothetical protein
MGSTFLNFCLIGCESTKKCAKSTILNIKVRIRKYKCHQKIPWIRFAGIDISNYGIIYNKTDSKIIVFYKYFVVISSTVVFKNRPLLQISFSENRIQKIFWSHLYFRILTFMLQFVDSHPIRPKF